jgi:hypothetical protein
VLKVAINSINPNPKNILAKPWIYSNFKGTTSLAFDQKYSRK